MRTKTILLSALLGLASGAAAMAQTTNVYSVNAVGYINVTCPPGFTMIANQLMTTNTTLAGLIPTAPDGTGFYKFVGNNFQVYTFDIFAGPNGAWTPDGN